MAILIDPPAWPAHGELWSHLVSDSSYEELHEFARLLRLPLRAFDFDHYDLPASRYHEALALGALAVSGRELLFALQRARLRVRQAEKVALRPVRRAQFLRDEWLKLGDSAKWRDLGVDLLARWSEPHRHYHDQSHLEDVLLSLNLLEVHGTLISRETLLAAWFHDAIYAGNAGTDEIESASFAAQSLRDLDAAKESVELVKELIIATDPARGNAVHEAAPLLDADTWVLSSGPRRYSEYTSGVRTEYAHFSDGEFRAGRGRVLQSFLQRPEIYRTALAKNYWEERARLNLAGELSGLALSEGTQI